MQKRRLIGSCVIVGLAIGMLSGCGKAATVTSGAGLDELGKISVISREEDSGTRSVFAESIGFVDRTTGLDMTTEDCKIAKSSSEMIGLVGEEKAAIGYVSAGTYEEGNNVHSVDVAGETISRYFYLAYTGELSQVEEDFISYIRSAGQEIVAANFTPVKKTETFLSSKADGEITIGGSTSVSGLMQELADAYMKINTNAKITVIETDSTNGLNGAMEGTYDIGMASRELKSYEKELLKTVAIAEDKVTVIVNKENPLESISAEKIKEIYTGEISDWSEVCDEEEN